jgi:hypothetical protein
VKHLDAIGNYVKDGKSPQRGADLRPDRGPITYLTLIAA